MANVIYTRRGTLLGRIIVLIVLILVLVGGGLVWFDYLNVIDAKDFLSPIYSLLGRPARTGTAVGDDDFINLDAERLAIRLEALALKELDLDKRDRDLEDRSRELDQIAEQLEEDRIALDEMIKTINEERESAETIERNVEGVSQRLTNMPPERAVAILMELPDQTAISVLRKTEEIARRDRTSSIVPYWLALMASTPQGAAKAAELQRKMVNEAL